MEYTAVDLFAGVGGLSEGMRMANFRTLLAIENEPSAIRAYQMNHPGTKVLGLDIREVTRAVLRRELSKQTPHLLAGCPPCQGFSTMRTLNGSHQVRDSRNNLILEFLRMASDLKPYVIMLENVPQVVDSHLFKRLRGGLEDLGYFLDYSIVNAKDYGVPQNRRRLVLLGSRLGELKIAPPSNEITTVRDAIGHLPNPRVSLDPLHKRFPTHTPRIQERIRNIPKNGGSRADLPAKLKLQCHSDPNVGFRDVYGRLHWDAPANTITGGCLKPSKGRFIHPIQNRCISAREATLLQSFPDTYRFPVDISIDKLALLIGNALPPRLSYCQSHHIHNHLRTHLA